MHLQQYQSDPRNFYHPSHNQTYELQQQLNRSYANSHSFNQGPVYAEHSRAGQYPMPPMPPAHTHTWADQRSTRYPQERPHLGYQAPHHKSHHSRFEHHSKTERRQGDKARNYDEPKHKQKNPYAKQVKENGQANAKRNQNKASSRSEKSDPANHKKPSAAKINPEKPRPTAPKRNKHQSKVTMHFSSSRKPLSNISNMAAPQTNARPPTSPLKSPQPIRKQKSTGHEARSSVRLPMTPSQRIPKKSQASQRQSVRPPTSPLQSPRAVRTPKAVRNPLQEHTNPESTPTRHANNAPHKILARSARKTPSNKSSKAKDKEGTIWAPIVLADDSGSDSDIMMEEADEGEEDLGNLENKLFKMTSQLSNLQVKAKPDTQTPDEIVGDILTWEQYQDAVKAKKISKYKGKGGTAEEMYKSGKAFNMRTRRWVKEERAKEDKQKQAVQQELCWMREQMAVLMNRERQTQDLLSLQQKVEKLKAEKALEKEKCLDPKPDTTNTVFKIPTAPVLLVFDTNVYMECQDGLGYVIDILRKHRDDASILLPREVHRELDYLKTVKDSSKSFKSRSGSRLISELLAVDGQKSSSDGKRKYPVLRGQQDDELYRDFGHHRQPECLRHDDAILNCCLYFARQARPHRKVVLLSGDRNLRQVATMNGIESVDLKNTNFYVIGTD